MKALTALFASTMLLSVGCKKAEDDKGMGGGGESGAKPEAKPTETVGGTKPGAVEIAISCGSVGKDYETCKAGAEAWSKKSGHKVKLVTGPTSSTEQLALYQQLLAAGATDIDVFNLDVIWPGILGSFFLDLKEHSQGAEKQHFPAIVQNNTVDGKLIAMPWFTDAGILYYRKDLLEKHKEKVPTTWEEMAATAKKIQDAERKAGNKDMWGFVFQGKAYEGLTCNALEWITSFGGGSIIDPEGKVTIDNPQAAQAIDMVAGWIGTISPKGVLSYEEEEARGVFQSGKSVFMRNWPYALELSQDAKSPIKDKVGVTVLPKGSGPGARNAATLGGWNLGVSKFTKHPKEAVELALYLTGPEEQKRRAMEGGFHPTIQSLYEDPEILEKRPTFKELGETFKNAAARPSAATKGKYNQVSTEFWNAVHATLTGQKKAQASFADLKSKLEQMSRGGRW